MNIVPLTRDPERFVTGFGGFSVQRGVSCRLRSVVARWERTRSALGALSV